jgi:hypothetical protein
MAQAGRSESIRDDAFPIATGSAIMGLMKRLHLRTADRDGPKSNRLRLT